MKTYIWASPMRLFHWFLFVSIVCAYIIGEDDELLNIHAAFGYAALILLIFRVIYGLTGPTYSRFKDFPIKISAIRAYLGNMKASKHSFAGHNPASALIMLAILVDTFLVGLSGMLALSAKGHGLLKGFVQPGNPEFFKESHELFVTILIILVLIHIAGLALDFYNNRKTGTIKSIFTGYKNIESEGIKESKVHNVLLLLALTAAFSVFVYTAKSNNTSERSIEQFEESEKGHHPKAPAHED